MSDLSTTYLGLALRSPLVASASPLTGELDSLRRLEDCGAAAVVLPSMFEEQITHEMHEHHRLMSVGAELSAESTSFFPEPASREGTADHYLRKIEMAKRALGIPVMASLNGATPGGWERFARQMQEAGADALELNIYIVAADGNITSDQIEQRYIDMVMLVRDAVEIPVAVKVGPYFSAFANMAHRIVNAGADGLVLFNRFYQPDVDLDHLEVAAHLELSTSFEMRLPLRWIAILQGSVGCSLAASTGISSARDVLKMLLVGADVTMMTSALLRHGPEHLMLVEDELERWISNNAYSSVEQLRGSLSQRSVPDPAAFERANYMKVLNSYSDLGGYR